MEGHRQQAKEQREQLNALLMNRKKTDTKVSDNNIITVNNADYENKKYQSTENKKRQVDINQLLIELDDPMFS